MGNPWDWMLIGGACLGLGIFLLFQVRDKFELCVAAAVLFACPAAALCAILAAASRYN